VTAAYFVRNPADRREVVAELPAHGAGDGQRALARARDALAGWRRTSIVERADVLRRAALVIRRDAETIARDVTREMGKLIAESRAETVKAAEFFEYYASFGRRPVGEVLADARPGAEARTVREPRGVVLAIVPWNDPVLTPARKLGPALVSGNTVVLKPAPESPLSALHLARCLSEAGMPSGVLEVLTGADDELGRSLVSGDGYDALTFTGSTDVGGAIRRRIADRNIPLQTEMGGKNATVVLRDANLDLAVDAIAAGAFAQAGQRCTATSRVLVERARADELVARLSKRIAAIRVGPGLDESSTMGPLVAESRLDFALDRIEEARDAGADVLAGGHRHDDSACRHGWFLTPTLLHLDTPRSPVWDVELFAPIVSLTEVESLDEAIGLVNASRYGLSASIFTRDLEAAHRFSAEADVGCVAVNLPTAGWDVHVPFGGFKDSGSAFKEQGVEALAFATRVKTIAMRAIDPT
jgi:alpha-ketoglutaric semialdehyde dehydrogenase